MSSAELEMIDGLNYVNSFSLLYSTKTVSLETSDAISITSDHTVKDC